MTEEYITESLGQILKDKKRTIIAIAHRLSTLKSMDRIIVLDKGKIVAEGTHRELEKSSDLYQTFRRLQTYH